jgi:prophage antirepressor-like protein
LKTKRRRPKHRQFDLWGNPVETETRSTRSGEVIPFDFETHPVRFVSINGAAWCVLADVARVLGYRDAEQAARLLRDKHRGTIPNGTPGAAPGMLVVNEPGLYRLMLRSNKPEAERFQDWVTEEVLPSIRKTGSYTMPRRDESRVTSTQRRLGCDQKTAKARVEQVDANKKMHARMGSERATPNHFRANHNAAYRGEFDGLEAADLRERLGVTDSPLNHMEAVPLSINTHAKTLAEKFIAANKIPLCDQPAVFERFARDITQAGLGILGDGYILGFTTHDRRGLVIDAIAALPCPA